jgi:NMT1/THI5 like
LIGVWWALRPVATGNLFLCATAVAILCNCGPSARNAASPVLEVAIGRVGLKPKDVQIVDLQPEKVNEALIRGKVDAILTFEPSATQGLDAIRF